MIIREVHLRQFGCWKDQKFSLAPGVTLLTAGNGQGKSTVLHGLVWGIWGQKLRNYELLPGASVSLTTNHGARQPYLDRRITARGEVVTLDGVESNKTRALEAIQSIWGDYSAWNRTLWVTGRTVSRFSLGTPTEKFQHLVAVTGAARYDKALSAATDLVRVRRDAAATQPVMLLNGAKQAVSNARLALRHYKSSYELLPGGPSVPELEQKIRDGERAAEAKEADLRVLRAEEVTKTEDLNKLRQELGYLRQELRDSERGLCPACGQAEPKEGDAEIRNAVEVLQGDVDTLQSRLRVLAGWIHTGNQDVLGIQSRCVELKRDLNSAALSQANLKAIEECVQTHVATIVRAERALKERAEEVQHFAKELQEAEQARTVIANARKGHLLSFTDQIEASANHYLSVIGAKPRIALTFEEGKLRIETSGTGAKEYADLSGGEGRRVDLCIVLAMAMAAADVGTVPASAPLVVDEAFDTLDQEGVEALLYLACEVSKRRQVLLVSHAEPHVPPGPDVGHLRL